MIRKSTVLGVVLILASVPVVLADDVLPPPWRGDAGSTVQQWEFSTNMPPWSPEASDNSYGSSGLAHIQDSVVWHDSLFGRQGVVEHDGAYQIGFVPIANANNPDLSKWIWIQTTYYQFNRPRWYEVNTTRVYKFSNPPLIDRIDHGDGWWTDVVLLTLDECPDSEEIELWFYETVNYRVDQVVIDTICGTIPPSFQLQSTYPVVTATITDLTPYGPSGVNDCNSDGDFTDPEDDTDCDGDGILDIVATLYSEDEPVGEQVVLNETETSGFYRGEIPVSTRFDLEDVLFVRRYGASEMIVRGVYHDLDDGTGLGSGYKASTTLSVDDALVVVKSYVLSDNMDNDGIADAGETVEMAITVINKSTVPLTNVTARLLTDDPDVDCILDNEARTGFLGAGETLVFPETFLFRVALVERLSTAEELAASFTVTFDAAQIGTTTVPQDIVMDLDLDIAGGGPAVAFHESFEDGSLGVFTAMELDQGLNSLAASDGYRCPYSDPDYFWSNTLFDPLCYMQFPGLPNGFNWYVQEPSIPGGGRAYEGTRSLHFGSRNSLGQDTTVLGQLEAVVLSDPLNLALQVCEMNPDVPCDHSATCEEIMLGDRCVDAMPELSFKHQVSLMDNRYWSDVPVGEALDRALVQVQLADEAGTPVGVWHTIRPYHNLYDVRGTAVTSLCMFDPIDDGHDEDDLFATADLQPKLGPSSSCYGEFVFGHQGETAGAFSPTNIGRASDGPGLQGSLGPGTWVETRFLLQRFRGRSIRIRLLGSTSKYDNSVDYLALGVPGAETVDDGWYIDDIAFTGGLSAPADVSVDFKDNSGLPECPLTNCSTVTAFLTAAPSSSPGPGEPVILDASASVADACVSGTLQYEFWFDENGNDVPGDPGDERLRQWTDDPFLTVSPVLRTPYLVQARCSSEPTCLDVGRLWLPVNGTSTPGEANSLFAAWNPATQDISVTYTPACETADNTIVFGPLQDVGSYAYSGQECSIGNSGTYAGFDPGPGSYYFMVVANDGLVTEGSYGLDSDGQERPEDLIDPTCSLTRDLSQRCDP